MSLQSPHDRFKAHNHSTIERNRACSICLGAPVCTTWCPCHNFLQQSAEDEFKTPTFNLFIICFSSLPFSRRWRPPPPQVLVGILLTFLLFSRGRSTIPNKPLRPLTNEDSSDAFFKDMVEKVSSLSVAIDIVQRLWNQKHTSFISIQLYPYLIYSLLPPLSPQPSPITNEALSYAVRLGWATIACCRDIWSNPD
jgi:hypothetical protein